MGPVEILITVLVGVVCLAAGVLVGILYRKNVAEAKIGTAEQKAKELVEEGAKQAETLKKEALLSAKEEIMRQKNDMEQEIKERRAEVSRTESRLSKKEENLDKKSEQLDKKNEQLDRKLKDCDAVREQIDATLEEQKLMLERVSGYTAEQAKAELVSELEEEIRHEQAQRIVELEAQLLTTTLQDVDMAVINGNYAIDAGLKVADAVAIEAADGTAAEAYANILTVKEGNENDPRVKALIEVLQSETIKNYITEKYQGSVVPMN